MRETMRNEIARASDETGLYAALTFIKVAPGTRNPSARTSGTNPSSVSYSCRGLVVSYDDADVNGETIKDGDRRISILANTLATTPSAGDRVVSDDGLTYEVIGVSRSPSGALYILHGRG